MGVLQKPDPAASPSIRSAVKALRRVAEYHLPPTLDQWMLHLGERKEFLSEDDHAHLMALVQFAQDRSNEKLQAELALRQLEESFPAEARE